MNEKIFQKLQTLRGTNSNVSDKTLQIIAESYSKLITTDEALEAFDFSPIITNIEGNINFTAAEAVKRIKSIEPKKTEKEKSDDKKSEDSSESSLLLLKKLEELSNQVLELKSEKVMNSRLDRIKLTLAKAPEFFKTPILSTFENTNFEDDQKFDEFVNTIDQQWKKFEESAKEQGLNYSVPPAGVDTPKVDEGATPELASAFDILDKTQEKK